MACYRPVTAWKPVDGPIFFSEKKDCREIQIACGQCIGCRIAKREAWALRIVAESKMHKNNCFITLTYDDDNVPSDHSLNYSHFQKFMRTLRKRTGMPIRFFMCGEYGDSFDRPHYHALLFGFDFSGDRVKSNSIYSSNDVYRSELLERCWTRGFSSIGELNYATARYCAAYVVKKVNGDLADDHYMRVLPSTGECVWLQPEFARMSLKPGIGESFVREYYRELVVHDGMVVGGKVKRLPKYFDEKIGDIIGPDADGISYERSLKMIADDNTPERLAVREAVIIGREKFNKERRNG